MKTKMIIIAAAGFLALASLTAEKIYTLKFSEANLNLHYKNLSIIRDIASKSNLPHQEVLFITSSIDSLQKEMTTQVRGQLEPPVKK